MIQGMMYVYGACFMSVAVTVGMLCFLASECCMLSLCVRDVMDAPNLVSGVEIYYQY